MGGCISAPVKAGRIISRRLHYDNRPKPLPENNLVSPRSTSIQVGNVLKNPTGNNIREKYQIGKELGRGEFGVTYKCYEKETWDAFACKIISKAKLKTEIDIEDVRREVEIMRHLPKHPNIVSFKEAYEDKDAVYLVMELCEGGELFDRIVTKGHYTERAAAMVTKTILEIVKVSEQAKELVKGMLDQNPYNRLTVEEVLEHPWIQNARDVPNVNLGENVGAKIKQFSLMNKFKKRVLRVVADNLPDEQVDGIKQMFYMMDTDNTGDLTFEELKNGLHHIGQPLPDPDVRMLMDAADIDGNGTLSIEEFVAMSIHLIKTGNDEHLSQAFRFFDKNHNGYIEFDELKDAMVHDNLGPNNEQIIKDIISDADLDQDGRISYEEFKAMMKSGMDWKMASRQYSRAMLNALSMKLIKDKSIQLKT
ncbi:hypothetical protein GH714_007916 [Hevea brasiliensis]|uniref:non-specific serine/threonine protein kinase n=1 Tax=Hevea brasiliensis TaxID=3981 RepID=A0A6A6N7J8_HEVBR|nr:hypothetical protein GH714_007916 [Hevea brasiliensis]